MQRSEVRPRLFPCKATTSTCTAVKSSSDGYSLLLSTKPQICCPRVHQESPALRLRRRHVAIQELAHDAHETEQLGVWADSFSSHPVQHLHAGNICAALQNGAVSPKDMSCLWTSSFVPHDRRWAFQRLGLSGLTSDQSWTPAGRRDPVTSWPARCFHLDRWTALARPA